MKVELHGVKELQEFFKTMPKRSECAMLRYMAQKSYRYAKKYAAKHHRTGNMEHNIDFKASCKNHFAEIYVADDGMLKEWRGRKINYALFVHEGTRPHYIYPKYRKALRWVKWNKFAYAKAVHHPGYKGDPFLKRAVDKAAKETKNYFAKVIDGL